MSKYQIGDKLKVIKTDREYSPLAKEGVEFTVQEVFEIENDIRYGSNEYAGSMYYVREKFVDRSRPEGDDWV